MNLSKVTDPNFLTLCKWLPPLDLVDGPWITGGCARKLYQNQSWSNGDVDVFFRSQAQCQEWINWMADQQAKFMSKEPTIDNLWTLLTKKPSQGIYLKMETENALTYEVTLGNQTIKLQLIRTRYAPTLEELWKGFDITVCEVATDGHYIMASDQAVQHLAENKLALTNKSNGGNLPLRIIKYHMRGFEASSEDLKWAAQQIANGELEWDTDY